MSHFSRIKTNVTNREYLLKALKKMGYSFRENSKCKGYNGKTFNADIVVDLPNSKYNIAFKKKYKNYELVADWYGINGLNWKKLKNSIEKRVTNIENKIKQEYAYNNTIEKLKDKGFSIKDENRENGEIRIKLTRIV